MLERQAMRRRAHVVLVAAAALVFARGGSAQPSGSDSEAADEQSARIFDAHGETAPLPDAVDAEISDVGTAPSDELDLDASLEQLDEAELPPGLAPLASYVVADEITVRGLRPGDVRKRLWDLDLEIENTVVSFFRELNEVIVDPQFHVRCVRAPRRSPAPGFNSRIMERYCYAGFQMDELESMTALSAGGGAYEPNPNWLLRKEQEYSDIVLAAIAEIPSLAVAAEELVRMQEERLALTGGEPSLSIAQYERQQARERFFAQFERLEQRRQRKAERQAERDARRGGDDGQDEATE